MRLVLLFILISSGFYAQEPHYILNQLETKLDSMESFDANVQLDVDIDFVNMPTKKAVIHFKKGEKIKIEADNFLMVPKRGLDFTMKELLRYPYLGLNTGKDTINGVEYTEIKVIPESSKADFSIATLMIDTERIRVMRSEISTKKNGVFIINYTYDPKESEILPARIEVELAISDVKIPLRFLAKEVEIDKTQLKEEDQTGFIYIQLSNYNINWLSKK
ncbi:MAG: hypothetical protein ACR2MM_10835 [Flavobacteriaceae bacterium]